MMFDSRWRGRGTNAAFRKTLFKFVIPAKALPRMVHRAKAGMTTLLLIATRL